MEIVLHISADFDAVYLINGAFFDSAKAVRYTDTDVMYITVLPLKAHLMSYTVKMCAGKPLCNEELISVYTLPAGHFSIKFKARYNYVYSPVRTLSPSEPATPPARLFECVKRGDVNSARLLLTAELNQTVDDEALLAFFDGIKDVIENQGFISSPPSCYFFIDEQNRGALYRISLKAGLIDDIAEM